MLTHCRLVRIARLAKMRVAPSRPRPFPLRARGAGGDQ